MLASMFEGLALVAAGLDRGPGCALVHEPRACTPTAIGVHEGQPLVVSPACVRGAFPARLHVEAGADTRHNGRDRPAAEGRASG